VNNFFRKPLVLITLRSIAEAVSQKIMHFKKPHYASLPAEAVSQKFFHFKKALV